MHATHRLVICGGVACNSALREAFRLEGEAAGIEVHVPSPLFVITSYSIHYTKLYEEAAGIEVHVPSPLLCSDNAAMLGVPAESYLRAGCRNALDVNAVASWPLDQAGREILATAGGA